MPNVVINRQRILFPLIRGICPSSPTSRPPPSKPPHATAASTKSARGGEDGGKKQSAEHAKNAVVNTRKEKGRGGEIDILRRGRGGAQDGVSI